MNEESVRHGGSPQQHSKLHVIPAGETEIDIPSERSQGYRDTDEGTDLLVAARITDGATAHHWSVTLDHGLLVILVWMHREADSLLSRVGKVSLETKGVDR